MVSEIRTDKKSVSFAELFDRGVHQVRSTFKFVEVLFKCVSWLLLISIIQYGAAVSSSWFLNILGGLLLGFFPTPILAFSKPFMNNPSPPGWRSWCRFAGWPVVYVVAMFGAAHTVAVAVVAIAHSQHPEEAWCWKTSAFGLSRPDGPCPPAPEPRAKWASARLAVSLPQ